jgi:hypothetical protein
MREVEHLVEWKLEGDTEVLEHLPHRHSELHESRVSYLGFDPDTHCEKPELWHGTIQRKPINKYNKHDRDRFVPVRISKSV